MKHWVGVVAPGRNDDEAQANCRSLPAYRQLLAAYPAHLWHRKWVRTVMHTGDKWVVEFEVEEKAGSSSNVPAGTI